MKALVLSGPGEFEIKDVATPRPGEDEVLMRVKACTICGTDMRVLDGRKTKGVRYPSVIGHEIAGVVEAVGGSVAGFEAGNRVCIAPVIPCHACPACLEGRENACRRRQAIGYEFDGGFAEYVLVPSVALQFGHLIKIPEGVSFEEAALAEPLACCVNGYRKTGVGLGASVLIVGAGPIGLMHLQLARVGGARQIIVSEPHPYRREQALRFGAHAVLDPNSVDMRSVVGELTAGQGVDAVVLAIGVTEVINELLHVVRVGGCVNLFAGFTGGGDCTLEANVIHYNEITVNGTTAATRLDYRTAVSLITSGSAEMGSLVSRRFALDSFREAYELQNSGEALKIAITPDSTPRKE